MKERKNEFVECWVVIDNFGKRIFKYQAEEAKKYGFTSNGVMISKHYKNKREAMDDSDNIREAAWSIFCKRTGKAALGRGCLINGSKYNKIGIYDDYFVWNEEGMKLFNNIIGA